MIRTLISLVILGLLAGVTAGCRQSDQNIDLTAVEDRQLVELAVGEQMLTVEVVNASESTTRGLSGREEIGSDGMLFAFSDRSIARFWMKEMLFALDMVWIDGKEVIGVTENVPFPDPVAAPHTLPLYTSPSEVTAVLEVPAGMASEYGIVEGATITPVRLIDSE
ncbi:MAG: DUF192 domain-containing protein [Patescibacteria group bacterium]